MTTELLNNNDGFEFDAGAAFDIDQDTVETPDATGPAYPFIQWGYGNQKDATKGDQSMDGLGGWFFSAENKDDDSEEAKSKRAAIVDALKANGWKDHIWVHDDGSSTAGVWKREAVMSVIAARKRWEVKDAAEEVHYAPWEGGYEKLKAIGNPKSGAQFLIVLKGLEDITLTVAVKGSAGASFEGGSYCTKNFKFEGALSHMQKTVIAKANQLSADAAKKSGKPAPRWPLRCFWLPVGANRDASGKPVFTKVGTGDKTSMLILPVALGLSKDPDLKRFYVGPELKERTQAIYEENEEWRSAWDTFAPAAEEPAPAPAARSAAKAPEKPAEAQLEAMGL